MIVSRVSQLEASAALADRWNGLVGDHPFRSWEWLHAWWQHFGVAPAELYVLTVADESGELVGLAPWFLERRPAGGRVVRFLGSGRVSTDHLTIFSQPSRAPAVAAAIADWLLDRAASAGDGWDLLELDCVPEVDRPMQALVAGLRAGGCIAHQRRAENLWRLELPRCWDAYLAGRSKARRKRWRQRMRRLEQDSYQLLTVSGAGDLPRGLNILIDLHQKRRHMLRQAGCFDSPRFTAFVQDACQRLLPRGNLLLSRLEFDGRPVASELSFVDSESLYLYQSGMDPDALEDEPGNLIMLELVRRAIGERRRYADFLRGDEPYKAQWGAAPIPTCNLRIAANHTLARVRQRVWMAGTTMKDWLKEKLQSAP